MSRTPPSGVGVTVDPRVTGEGAEPSSCTSMKNFAQSPEQTAVDAYYHEAAGQDDRALLSVICGSAEWEGPRGQAWAALWGRHAAAVSKAAQRRACRLWVGDTGMQAELAEEAVARVVSRFTRLAEARRLGPQTQSLEAFLRTSVRNACTDVFREQKGIVRETRSMDESERPLSTIAEPRGDDMLTNCAARDLLRRLAADPNEGWKQATVLRLFYGEEWPTGEIAAYFRVTERTVYRWKHEGLRKVRRLAEVESSATRSENRRLPFVLMTEGVINEDGRSISSEANVA
jgi:RNA polymerase sigma factor (sigma-70 family)